MARTKKKGFRQSEKIWVDLHPRQQLLNHAALTYANLWFRQDRYFFLRAQTDDVFGLMAPMKEISAAYSIHRNLPKQIYLQDWHKIALLLANFRSSFSSSNYIAQVLQLAEELPGTKKLRLSAASKLAWFCNRWPIRIFDTRAVEALRRLGFLTGEAKYLKYCTAWQSAFTFHKCEIQAALIFVNANLHLTLVPEKDRAKLYNFCRENWYLERVFDQYLWLIGGGSDFQECFESALISKQEDLSFWIGSQDVAEFGGFE